MATMDGGALVGRILNEQRVKYLFAINGGHTFPILANLRNNGVKLIHMRHEQACAYAADAYARTTATPGVCSVTAGCGLTNAVTGLCVAGLTGSAVVCIAGQHPTTEDHLGSFQEAYGAEVCRTFSKFVKRTIDWSTIEVDLRQAFAPPSPTRKAWRWWRSRPTSSTSRTTRCGSAREPRCTIWMNCARKRTR